MNLSLWETLLYFPANGLLTFHLLLAFIFSFSNLLINTYFPRQQGASGAERQGMRLSADLAILLSDIPSKQLDKIIKKG
jgi:hypothetical protein